MFHRVFRHPLPWCLALPCLLGMMSAQADSYVYLTNSTSETVQVRSYHFGDDTLVEGSEWRQEATEIAPYATARVLAFNRYEGLKSGKTYHFETQVTGQSSTVTLQQKMQGTWYGSTIEHSASGSDFNAPWQDDRDIHRHDSTYDGLASRVAFKADYTGGYDDFYYTIRNGNQPEPQSGDDALKVLTYNIWALPMLASNIGDRLEEMPSVLQGYDVLLLQEAFASASEDLLQALSSDYPYQTEILDEPGFNLYNGGVVIVSRYPIAATDYLVFQDCTGTDCFADKGVVYAEVIRDGKAYHVTATHTASFDSDEARALRQQQFQQIRGLIDGKGIPAFDAVMMGGDFNVNKLKFPGDYQQMLANLVASAPEPTGYSRSTYDPTVNQNADGELSLGVEYLDYVVVSNSHRQPQRSRNDVRVPRSDSDDLWGIWDLSDHFPVLGDFQF
ncbi:sphingomyelin phosphodiesterase [Marinobacter sp. SS21]|uniref:sphingomyelin phosphodiesterase n=1 Tax=Marinobacter sp. SS21 TaxID=2979460 RepID=UPI00232F8365|nr:sphingomyelin phosphodiesterase [Marinobacter sp. SS21]MDC0661274.1 sphingomyelin phosphodiesterase [Marinobacter sp. SS21]